MPWRWPAWAAGGFDGIVITHTATDIAPAWRDQLAEGGRLVVPLQIGGYTRSVTLVRRGDTFYAEHWTYCGFVRDRGTAARTVPMVRLAGGAVTVRWENGVPGDTGGLDEALRRPRHELATGLVAAPLLRLVQRFLRSFIAYRSTGEGVPSRTPRCAGAYGLWVTQSISAGQRCAQSGGSVWL
ncbi:hypothetical protein [Streptomyces sp. NPDC088727]|uniref:hypothetical protein n=1 Tax=Streptomyces sp. NPDC088727 TaxID=3365875 RepID=UPI0037FC4116